MANLDIIRGRQVILTLTNRSGGAVNEGDVVIVDIGNDESFTTTVVVGSLLVQGVVQEDIANLAVGRVLVEGRAAIVEVNDATARGDFLKTSGVATRATSVATMDSGVFARAETSTVGAGQVVAELFGPSSGTAAPSATVGAYLRRVAAQAIGDSADVAIIFDTEDRDDDNFWAGGQPTRLTAGTSGWHIASIAIRWETDTAGVRWLNWKENGATFLVGDSEAANHHGDVRQTHTITKYLNATDFLEVLVRQSSGFPLDITEARAGIVRLP